MTERAHVELSWPSGTSTDFAELNNEHGHAAGDRVVRWVAQTLTMTLDAAGSVARYGGDEYAVILPDMGQSEAAAFLEAAWAAIRIPVAGLNLRISAACGAVASIGERDWKRLLGNADMALYQAKRSDGGVHFYRADER